MFDSEFYNTLSQLSLAMTHKSNRNMSGNRKSVQKGVSAEFSDFREYMPGDDLRRLDWNVYARLDRMYIREYMEDKEELRGIVNLTEGTDKPVITSIMSGEELLAARSLVAQIPIADAVMDYILDLVMATHKENPYIREGASPRAAQAIIRTARARAFMEGRFNVAFEDVKSVAYPVLRHRILLSFDAISEEITGDAIIEKLL